MLETTIQSDIAQRAADLRTAEQQIAAQLRTALIVTTLRLTALERTIVHVLTGRLRASLTLEGPFPIGVGAFETRIVPRVPYADDEAARGGSHDFPARTLAEGQGIIDQAAEEMGADVLAIMEGR